MIALLRPLRAFTTLGILTLLAACAGREKAVAPPRAVSTIGAAREERAPRAARVAEVAALDRTSTETAAAKRRFEDHVEGIVLGVDSEGYVVVQKDESKPESASSALFEDSIVLTKLRGKLYLLADLPVSVIDSARVRSGMVFLFFQPGTTVRLAAAAINAALATPGVRQVRVRIPQPLVAAG